MTVGRRIALGTGFLCLMLALSVLFGTGALRRLMNTGDDIVGDSLPGLALMAQLSRDSAENEIRMARMVAGAGGDDASVRKEMEALSARVDGAVRSYGATVKDDGDRRLFDQVLRRRADYERLSTSCLALLDKGDRDGALRLYSGQMKSAYAAYASANKDLTLYNSTQASALGAKLAREVHRDVRLFVLGGLLALVVGIALAAASVVKIGGLLRSVSGSLDEGAGQVAAAASQVAGSSGSLAQGATEQAASLEETSASLEEMAGMTRRNAENASKAKETARVAREAADAGYEHMKAMHAAVEDIRAASEQIRVILKTIDEIAFQTNILALNAAVEAARAGEAGAGFAVVADEVRSLAQRAAGAARETAEKIEASTVKSRLGVSLSTDVTRSFEAIQGHVRNLAGLVAEIAQASAEQSQGIDQVAKAVSEMDRVVQANASGAEETAAAAEELNAQSSAMRELVDGLVTLAGRRTQAAPTTSA